MTEATIEADPVPAIARKGERTRRLLLDAAKTVFAQHGYVNAEIGQITREAGKSIGVFYKYFPNKAAILNSLIDEFLLDMRAQVAYPDNPPENAGFVLTTLWTTHRAHAPTLRALSDAAAVDADFAAQLHTLRGYARQDFAGMIRARQAHGNCRHLDAEVTAMALETMATRCMTEWSGTGVDEQVGLATLIAVVNAVLFGRN